MLEYKGRGTQTNGNGQASLGTAQGGFLLPQRRPWTGGQGVLEKTEQLVTSAQEKGSGALGQGRMAAKRRLWTKGWTLPSASLS